MLDDKTRYRLKMLALDVSDMLIELITELADTPKDDPPTVDPKTKRPPFRLAHYINESGVGEYFSIYESFISCPQDHQRTGYHITGVFELHPVPVEDDGRRWDSQSAALPTTNLEAVPRRFHPSLENARIFNAAQPVLALAHSISRCNIAKDTDWLNEIYTSTRNVLYRDMREGSLEYHLRELAALAIAWLADREPQCQSS